MKLFRTLAAGITMLLAVSFASAQTIVVLASTLSHKVLTIDSTATDQRVPVVQADYVNTPNQRWTLHSAGGGKYYIYNTADGRALEATTSVENEALYASDLNWEDGHQMWRFSFTGLGERAITSAFNGLAIATDGNNWWEENAPVIQTRSGNALTGWLVVPVHSVPSCGAFTAEGHDGLGYIHLARVRNALRVGFWTWSEPNGQGTAIWREAIYIPSTDTWEYAGVEVESPTDVSVTYRVDAYGLGADNQWRYFGTTSQIFTPRTRILPPPRQ